MTTVPVPAVGAITLFVEDLARSRAFYEDVFGLQAVHTDEASAVFDVGTTLVNLLSADQAPALIEPAPVAPPGAGARFQLSIWVDDVDAACEALRARGVTLLNGPLDRPWGKRTAAFTDPAGTIWELAQDLPAADGP